MSCGKSIDGDGSRPFDVVTFGGGLCSVDFKLIMMNILARLEPKPKQNKFKANHPIHQVANPSIVLTLFILSVVCSGLHRITHPIEPQPRIHYQLTCYCYEDSFSSYHTIESIWHFINTLFNSDITLIYMYGHMPFYMNK